MKDYFISNQVATTFSNKIFFGTLLRELQQKVESSSNSKFVLCKDGLIPVTLEDEPKESSVESSALVDKTSTFSMLEEFID